jgi:hypothetical protein
LDLRVNTSLARDLVEYKRELNKATSFVDQRMSDFVCAELERVVTDDGRYHDYLSPGARAKLLRDVAPGNATLVRDFGMTPFPALAEQSANDWKSYPGLSPERARELRERHNTIKRSAGYQLERATLLLRQVTRRFRAMFASTDSTLAWRTSRREAPQASKPS